MEKGLTEVLKGKQTLNLQVRDGVDQAKADVLVVTSQLRTRLVQLPILLLL